MGNEEFESKSRKIVSDWICNHEPMNTDVPVYCVWFSKTLQNAKGLFSADRNDGLYFEITYNGDKDEFYLDVYRKLENKAISNYEEFANEKGSLARGS